jgi:peptidoglycan/LPS O-acetylase OafA/YrhL
MENRNSLVFRISETDGHILALDGIRGIAIIWVMLSHYFMYATKVIVGDTVSISEKLLGHAYNMLWVIADAGWSGVNLFFVLSGFLITGILLDTKEHPHYFTNFYVRRIVRIFPLYYCYIFFLCAFPNYVFPTELGNIENIYDKIWWIITYMTNFLVGNLGFKGFVSIGHFWSLAIEEQFYLVWPFLIFYLNSKKLIYLCCVLIILSLVFRVFLLTNGVYSTVIYAYTFTRSDALLTGALVALLIRTNLSSASIYTTAKIIAIISSLLLAGLVYKYRRLGAYDFPVQTVGYSLLNIFFASFLIIAISFKTSIYLHKLICSSVLRFFGKYSYGLYVWHPAVISCLIYLGMKNVTVFNLQNHPLLLEVIFMFLATVGSILVSLLSWHLYEKHFLKLKKFVAYKKPLKPVIG